MANSLGMGKWHHSNQGSKRNLKTEKSTEALESRTNYKWYRTHTHALTALKKKKPMKSTLTKLIQKESEIKSVCVYIDTYISPNDIYTYISPNVTL